ncbi:poly-gamma-glutamate synthase PgsB [Streptantibioticus parmotrematis]
MLFLYVVLLLSCAVLLVAGVLEQRRHYASLEQIPVRVLVNGIRGKSSITRLCAGALRGGGLVTVGKTTGTAARFIHPDATEEPVYRKFGLANVVEQIGIVRRAATYRPDALVIECMAVMPALQEINQEKLIRSTIGVLCNVREDHLAEMGPTLDDVARSLCRSMPVGGICVTAEKDRLHILQEEADKRDCRLVAVDPELVTDEELRGFSWFTFKENVAIALAVADLLGVDRATAMKGMWEAPPDPGVLSVERYVTGEGKKLRFANVFAANDPESTLMNVQQLETLGAIRRPLSVVINCRPDRVERNGQMGAIVPDLDPDTVFLIGHPTKSARDGIPASWQGNVIDLGGDRRDPHELTREMLAALGPDSSMVAVGNIHGQGELFLECLAELPLDESEDAPLLAPDGTEADTGTMAVARPPEPEPYSWVAPLDSPAPHGGYDQQVHQPYPGQWDHVGYETLDQGATQGGWGYDGGYGGQGAPGYGPPQDAPTAALPPVPDDPPGHGPSPYDRGPHEPSPHDRAHHDQPPHDRAPHVPVQRAPRAADPDHPYDSLRKPL